MRSQRPKHATPGPTSAAHLNAYSLGLIAGATVQSLMNQRQDHVTCAVEWYRGFCSGCGTTPDPKVEAYITREATADTHGLPVVSIVEYLHKGTP